MKSLHKFALLLTFTLLTLSAYGADLTMYTPKVEYAADQTMETAETTITGKVYATPTKERREMNVSGETMVTIMRHDKQTAWTLIPAEQMYLEMSTKDLNQQAENLDNYTIETTSMGSEQVNGVSCEKSKVLMTNRKTGTKMGGFWWMTNDNIVMKMDMISKDKDEKMRIKLELNNLKIGKQSATLFEIPAGYSKMAMPSMGNLQQMMHDSNKDNAEAPAPKEKAGFNLKDAMKLIR